MIKKLSNIFDAILAEATANPQFARKLGEALGDQPRTAPPRKQPRNRRAPALIDPYNELKLGEDMLRRRLQLLNVDQLKDVVAQHSMDASKLALKWKDHQRLVDFIVTAATSRLEKGDAFRD